jgi:hypothetical protein
VWGGPALESDGKRSQNTRPVFGEKARAESLLVRQSRAYCYSLDLAPTIQGLLASGATSLSQIAAGLNAKDIPAPKGGPWRKAQVDRVMRRIGLKTLFLEPPQLKAKHEQRS